MKLYLLLLLVVLSTTVSYSQKTYEKAFGGNGNYEWQDDIKEMKDKGYLVTGSTANFEVGNYDAYCIKMNEKGRML